MKDIYNTDERVLKIAHELSSHNKQKIHIKGLCGSCSAFLASAVSNHFHGIQLFILNDKEEAAYFLNDLEALEGEKNVLFFPESFKYRHRDEIDKDNVLLRASVLSMINSRVITQEQPSALIVTYPEALKEEVAAGQHLAENSISISKGEKISIDFITELMYEYGFERTDFVSEPGQFAVRGGIVDIFSFSNENPYRAEFFGNSVESLRTFDSGTQLSVAHHQQITIMPDIHGELLSKRCESFFSFLPENTSIWIKDIALTADRVKLSAKELNEQFNRFALIEFGIHYYSEPDMEIIFNTSPQPEFKKNFDMLLGNMNENIKKGYKNIIIADSTKQIERLHSIFEDLEKPDFTHLMLSIHEGFTDHNLKISLYTDHQIFERYQRFRIRNGFNKREAITLKEFSDLKPGDFVVHIDHGIGRFAALEMIHVGNKPQEAVRLVYKGGDILYVSIHGLHRITKYSGKEGHEPGVDKLGSGAWNKLKQNTKKKVKDIAKDLIKLYAERKSKKGFGFSHDTFLQNELEASFIYEDTPDQIKSTASVKRDMESSAPMDRLICGDVGFGKTEIAIRAAFKSVADNKQVAVLAPTTILTLQHFRTFSERLADFPCNVDYINRFKSVSQQKAALKKLSDGKTDIIIGTHRLLSKDIKFKDLGLLIIDEEQKFGVSAKEKLRSFQAGVDTLTLTATPIPRTLQFSLMGARDLSVINTPPPNRHPIQTELHAFNHDIIRDAVEYEISRGGQVFFVHNLVKNIDQVADMIRKLCPGARTVTAHGQMEGHKLEKIMIDFIDGKYDVLVATTIIESGLDIPNANTIIINNAHQYGLSDLHQMRGRVGRSNKKAFCFILSPPLSSLTSEAGKRLKAIEEFSGLGSGFSIAMKDLDIRGAGNLLGAEQTGFITELGFDTYHKILDEAVRELKKEEFKDLYKEEIQKEFAKDCQIDTDMEILIPSDYVNNITERLRMYKEFDELENEDDLQRFAFNVADRFGPLPSQVIELQNTIRLRWLAKKAGFEKIVLKQGKLIGYFISDHGSPYYQSDTFKAMLNFVQQNQHLCRMKEANNKLNIIIEPVKSVNNAFELLQQSVSVRVDCV